MRGTGHFTRTLLGADRLMRVVPSNHPLRPIRIPSSARIARSCDRMIAVPCNGFILKR